MSNDCCHSLVNLLSFNIGRKIKAPFSSVFEDENEPSSPLFFYSGIFFNLCVGLLVGVCFFFFAQEMSCYLGTAACKGNICDQSPHQLQSYYSFSWAFEQELAVPVFLSAMLLAVLQCLTFSVLEPLWEKFTVIWSARGLLILSLIVMSVL